jgi:hypothetical protein
MGMAEWQHHRQYHQHHRHCHHQYQHHHRGDICDHRASVSGANVAMLTFLEVGIIVVDSSR